MSKPVISVKSLGKRYLLGMGGGERYRALRDVIANSFKNVFQYKRQKNNTKELWALRDFSFDVNKGERVGIIGKNGAGKTTLLKLLSNITEPTEGEIRLHGRVASLLEVGTGFHPELTGRENIFMNGAILGMTRIEIKRKYDEIVAFAEVEKFLDTPVKRYSSGMYVRLAFAVAAHLEPEILLIDEVLAVGDISFQKKCFGKMEDVAKEGRTILLVSHNMPSIINLCQRVILLDRGKKVMEGKPEEIVQFYLSTTRSSKGEVVWLDPDQAPGNDIVRLHSVRILQQGVNGATTDVDIAKDIFIQVSYWNLKEGQDLYVALCLKDNMGTYVLATNNHKSVSSTPDYWNSRPHPLGLFRSVCCIPGNFLNEGNYGIDIFIGREIKQTLLKEEYVVSFCVHDTGNMRKEFSGGWCGVVRPRLAWSTEHINSKVEKP